MSDCIEVSPSVRQSSKVAGVSSKRHRPPESILQRTTMAEEDEFWNIALSLPSDPPHHRRSISQSSVNDNSDHNSNDDDIQKYDDSADSDSINDDDDDNHATSPLTTYSLPTTPVTLEMRHLAPSDGVWSPLGAKAWYSSALLASMLLHALGDDDETSSPSAKQNIATIGAANGKGEDGSASLCRPMLFREEIRSKKSLTILELGSGAVGLSGMAMAVAMSRLRPGRTVADFPSSTVANSSADDPNGGDSDVPKTSTIILTDNDPSVLVQLKTNVNHNQHSWATSSETNAMFATTTVHVKNLDWNHPSTIAQWTKEFEPECPKGGIDYFSKIKEDPSESLTSNIDLVIGSELVYTDETAMACTKMLLHLLEAHPNISILIVQVTDRYGWDEVLVPRIHDFGASIQPLVMSTETHDLASTMIIPGGTLDRFAFGAVLIQNKIPPSNNI
jgi:hypothetical protein